ncbi:hypothetical protein ACJRO7_027838 [Eucalyptus globulus]|uniref:Uncharacterized protein n=1 Tax=Eucalyptus globulus TaxID=34317 RepID=A0ABD3JSI9_EUCGL
MEDASASATEWVSKVWALGLRSLTQWKKSSERTGSFRILSRTCVVRRGVSPALSGSSLSQSECTRWLCATLTKSRSRPLGSGIVRWGTGIGGSRIDEVGISSSGSVDRGIRPWTDQESGTSSSRSKWG